MAGLTQEGFTPLTLDEIRSRIQSKLSLVNPGFDFSIESPDGQLIEIMAYEVSQAWSQLDLVYSSYDPNRATGAALRNLGLITGIEYGAATRSQANIELVGTANTLISAGSVVTDGVNDFETQYDAYIPGTVQVISKASGVIPVPAGTITTIKSPVTGWTGVTQSTDGQTGDLAQPEQTFRNVRSRTVLRNYTSTIETIEGRLIELGLEQVAVVENDAIAGALPDGTPPNTIHVVISPVAFVTDEEIATSILNTKPAGIPTYGSTAVVVADTQGNNHTINFTKATAVPIFINLDVTYLSDEYAGAETSIKNALVTYLNNLQVGEDVSVSRMYSIITPYGKSEINTLEIGKTALTVAASNVVIASDEFATLSINDIVYAVTP